MSLRSKLKVPKYGLFYFESDRTVSVLPSVKIKNVVTGDNTTPGSVVEVQYGTAVLKATIIAVDGKHISFLLLFNVKTLKQLAKRGSDVVCPGKLLLIGTNIKDNNLL